MTRLTDNQEKYRLRGNMREQLEQRLKQLKSEYEAGQRMLVELEAKQASLRESLQRISGAIQALEEELAKMNKQ